MSIDFDAYLACLGTDHSAHRPALEAAYHDAARVMSPWGLQNYLDGIHALNNIGRNADLVLTYIQEMPEVARAVGEDIIPDIITAALKLSSLTSATVITLWIANLPLAARRLGDIDVMRGFFNLIHLLAGKAPRALRPMMANLDELLAKLTLGGLRRWVQWGVDAHQRDLEGQVAYFGLQTETSQAVLKKERRGTLLVDNQRKLNFYLRALWGRAFFMRPTTGDYESRTGLRPYIENGQMYLPDAFDDLSDVSGLALYRAATAHSAAHIVYTRSALSAEQLSPVQIKFVGLFEDARVEWLAIAEFPGLRKLWNQCFDIALNNRSESLHPVADKMLRMAYRLLNPEYNESENDIVRRAREFHNAINKGDDNNRISWLAGIDFYNALVSSESIPGPRALDEWMPTYRDDNRYCFNADDVATATMDGDFSSSGKQIRKYVSAIEMANEVDCELAGDDAQEIWVCASEFFPYEDEGISFNDMWGKEPLSDPCHYHEWDYRVQLFRPEWTSVVERRAKSGDPQIINRIVDRHQPVASRIRYIIDALQPQGIVRKRGYEEGEELDLNAAVQSMIDIRRGVMPDERFNIRITRQVRDLAVLLLLDLSESTNDPVDKTHPDGPTVLSLTRDAAGLLSFAIDSIGDPFAVHGFASDGRHDVQYFRFKDFDMPYNDDARARIAGMRGGLSTRMGAALRHAGWHLMQQPCTRRLVLLVTDGEPADIDERDPEYLRHDAHKAVKELTTRGVQTHCMTLDPHANEYVARIFGDNRYSIVDRVERLPERLPAVFASLTT
ncbi:MAG: hypothetical protein DHS20C01_08350 [marine bacterium B5-7]|nr:MAG: hypothetical protein DHS20C01_08350 [marine bacterium B5-7]